MNKMKTAAVSGILAVAMAASALAGCGSSTVDGTAAAITVNGESINMGAAEFYLRYQQSETTTMMQSYGLASDTFWDMDYSASSSEAEMTYGDNLKNSIRDTLVEVLVLSQHAEEYGVTVPEDLATSIQNTADSTYSDNQEAMDAMGATADDVKRVLELSTIQRLMYYPMVDDVDKEVSDEEAAQSSITYARIALTKYNSDTGVQEDVSDEDKETYMAELESLLLQVQSSDDVASADMSTMASNLDSTNIACTTYSYGADDDIMPTEVLEAAATLSDGEIYDGVIDTGDYYYLVRMDAVFDESATETKKSSIVSTRQSEAYEALLQQWVDEASVEESDAWKAVTVNDKNVFLATTATTVSADETDAEESVVASSSES